MNEIILQEFSRYKPAVQEELDLCLNRHGNFAPVLELFGHSASADLQQQAASVHHILAQYGQVFFMTVVKGGADPQNVQKMAKHITQVPDQAPPRTPTISHVPPSVQPRSPYAAPSHRRGQAQITPPESPGLSGPGPMIDVPGYKGPDRRKTSNRRRAARGERRGRVDMVYKNRRFGGNERRKTLRRATDREKTSEDT